MARIIVVMAVMLVACVPARPPITDTECYALEGKQRYDVATGKCQTLLSNGNWVDVPPATFTDWGYEDVQPAGNDEAL